MNPEQERDDWASGVADALIDAVISTNAGQCLAVIVGKKSIQRDGAGSYSVRRVVLGE